VQSLEGSSNEELLASLAGRPAAARLMGKFGGLSSLAQASFADLQQVPGVGPSKAAAIRSAFLLAQRLVRETNALRSRHPPHPGTHPGGEIDQDRGPRPRHRRPGNHRSGPRLFIVTRAGVLLLGAGMVIRRCRRWRRFSGMRMGKRNGAVIHRFQRWHRFLGMFAKGTSRAERRGVVPRWRQADASQSDPPHARRTGSRQSRRHRPAQGLQAAIQDGAATKAGRAGLHGH
jgi:hypothetical protein